MSSERYWTPRAAKLWEEVSRAAGHLEGDSLNQYIWTSSGEALTVRDAEALTAVFRLADARSDISCEVRFAIAMRAMERRYYECAYAAWDDGGRCWAEEPTAARNVPDSKTSATTMMGACDKLMVLESSEEQSLCDRMSNASV